MENYLQVIPKGVDDIIKDYLETISFDIVDQEQRARITINNNTRIIIDLDCLSYKYY